MRKVIFVALIALMTSTAAFAEGVVGFEFGINYAAAPSESSVEGYGKSFTLTFPMNETLTVGLRHEDMELKTEVGVTIGNLDADITQLVLTKDYSKRVGLSIALGYGTVSEGANAASAIAADVAVPLYLMSDKTEFGTVDLKLTPSYRMFDTGAAAPAAFTNTLTEFGGFNVGLSAAITF